MCRFVVATELAPKSLLGRNKEAPVCSGGEQTDAREIASAGGEGKLGSVQLRALLASAAPSRILATFVSAQ